MSCRPLQHVQQTNLDKQAVAQLNKTLKMQLSFLREKLVLKKATRLVHIHRYAFSWLFRFSWKKNRLLFHDIHESLSSLWQQYERFCVMCVLERVYFSVNNSGTNFAQSTV